MIPPTDEVLPAYVKVASLAAQSMDCDLWRWKLEDRSRVILAALNAMPVLSDAFEPGERDLSELLDEDFQVVFQAAKEAAVAVWEDIVRRKQERRRGKA